MKVGQSVAEIPRDFIFKMAAVAILDFQKFEILTVSPMKGPDVR